MFRVYIKKGCNRGHDLSVAIKLGTLEPKFLQTTQCAHQSAIREAPMVFSRLPSLMAADKPCHLSQPSLSSSVHGTKCGLFTDFTYAYFCPRSYVMPHLTTYALSLKSGCPHFCSNWNDNKKIWLKFDFQSPFDPMKRIWDEKTIIDF